MKDLLSKKHYCYKIHALLVKSRAYTPSIENPLFLQEDLIPPSMTVQKPQSPPSKNKGGSHYTCLIWQIKIFFVLDLKCPFCFDDFIIASPNADSVS